LATIWAATSATSATPNTATPAAYP
jgi:hypothetical protein